ncbi:MAG TPA: SAM-dependent methyltransferase [Burkholderiaceae bacterium]|nr:SAM-dependent methyltransferase [Burkholderiaceae bacterium]
MTELQQRITREIETQGGAVSFARFMELALYAPGLGYYTRSTPMGERGDFITAPELTPLFGRTLAVQLAQLFEAGVAPVVLELGAGTGKLARDALDGLTALGHTDVQWQILDVSTRLREVQRETLAAHGARVQWLERLPEAFHGVMLGNELLDAVPCEAVAWHDARAWQRTVQVDPAQPGRFRWSERPAPEGLSACLERLSSHFGPERRMDAGFRYSTEVNPQAEALVATLARSLQRGALLLLDYGFPAPEYYHPERHMGTLTAFARQRSVDDVLAQAGEQDITAHVDFSAMAQAGCAEGLALAGYTSQARFLMNCGLLDLAASAARDAASDPLAYARLIAPVQKLLSEAEMGELFKVLALTRGLDAPLVGFSRGDRSHRLGPLPDADQS